MQFPKAPKKDHFITNSAIAHFSKLHTGMEEDVVMYSTKARKSILENKKAQKQFQFDLKFSNKIKTEFMNEKSLKPSPHQVQLVYKFSDD